MFFCKTAAMGHIFSCALLEARKCEEGSPGWVKTRIDEVDTRNKGRQKCAVGLKVMSSPIAPPAFKFYK